MSDHSHGPEAAYRRWGYAAERERAAGLEARAMTHAQVDELRAETEFRRDHWRRDPIEDHRRWKTAPLALDPGMFDQPVGLRPDPGHLVEHDVAGLPASTGLDDDAFGEEWFETASLERFNRPPPLRPKPGRRRL